MPAVKITETVLRDGHQSLIATRMRTEDMLPICKELDNIGFGSLEVWGGATFDSCLRFLKEDPWQRLKDLRKALPNTPLSMLLRGQNLVGYRHYADDVVTEFVRKTADNGIDIFRVFDALNDLRNLESSIKAVKASGKHAQGTICYTTSPFHSIDQFVAQAVALAEMGSDSIVVKDMAGLLTPSVSAELFAALSDAVNLPLQLHSHATAGLAAMCQLKAIENGCGTIDTAISAFAEGSSHPTTESMVAALRGTEYDTGLDLEKLQAIGFYFNEVRKKYHQYESEFTGIDTRVQVNQVPGGMLSNLAHQLKGQGALNRMNEVLDEIPRVRKDLGYPPLVTPSSQIVGTQAVMNVMTGERYLNFTSEVKLYMQGRYGKAPAPVDEAVQKKATGGENIITHRPADDIAPELEKARKEYADYVKSEEDLLIAIMFPEVGCDFLKQREAGTLEPEELLPIAAQQAAAPSIFDINLNGQTHHVVVSRDKANRQLIQIEVDGTESEVEILLDGETSLSATSRPRPEGPGDVTSSMPATVIELLVKEGDHIEQGAALCIIEAMKMESEISAPHSGTVTTLYIAKGDQIAPNETLIKIENE